MTHRDPSLTVRVMSYIGGGKLTDEFAGNQTSGRHLSAAMRMNLRQCGIARDLVSPSG